MQPTAFTCSRCNAPLLPGVSQCPNCGMTFAAPVPIAPMPPYMAPPPSRPTTSPKIVVAIVLLGLLIVPLIGIAFFKDVTLNANESIARMNLRLLSVALKEYTQDYDSRMPPMNNISTFRNALNSYTPNTKDGRDPFIDPAANAPFVFNTTLSEKDLSNGADPSTIVVATQNKPFRGTLLTLFADGRVERVPEQGK